MNLQGNFLPSPSNKLVDDNGYCDFQWRKFFIQLQGGDLVDALDDVAAKAAGVKLGDVYRNGSVLMIRVI